MLNLLPVLILITNILLVPRPRWHIVELILTEVLNEGALVRLPVEFGSEFSDSHCLNVSQDVDFFSETFFRLFIPVVLKDSHFPPVRSLTEEAATAAFFQDLCYHV